MASIVEDDVRSDYVVRAIEFFSGIGGMHFALNGLTGVQADVVGAFDFSTTANEVYAHNFPGQMPSQKPIQSLTPKFLNSLGANMWLMSPPCQPYTRQNETEKRDIFDKRSNALLHLCNILSEIDTPPTYFLLENVVNFERSESCRVLKEALKKRDYRFHIHVLSPEHFSTPNTRPRVFLVATLDRSLNLESSSFLPNPCSIKQIRSFLLPIVDTQSLLIPEGTLASAGSWSLDIVSPSSTRSACFTHSYGRYMKGTGSVLLLSEKCEGGDEKDLLQGFSNSLDALKSKKRDFAEFTEARSDWYKRYVGKSRYFDPLEITNILGFPTTFSFPETVSRHKQYALAGNSLHVSTVTTLLQNFFPT